MLLVKLCRDIVTKDGKLYAKKGKTLHVVFKNRGHYLCRVGKLVVPVFFSQVREEVHLDENNEIEQDIQTELGAEPDEKGIEMNFECPERQ